MFHLMVRSLVRLPVPLQSTFMSTNEFSHQTVLDGHTAAVTALEFSPDGRFLASAGDDGVVLIFSTSSWMPVDRFVDVSPVSALAWHGKGRYLLFCGHQSGDLHVLTMSRSMVRARHPTCQRSAQDRQIEMYRHSNFEIWRAYLLLVPLTDIISHRHRLCERDCSDRRDTQPVSFKGQPGISTKATKSPPRLHQTTWAHCKVSTIHEEEELSGRDICWAWDCVRPVASNEDCAYERFKRLGHLYNDYRRTHRSEDIPDVSTATCHVPGYILILFSGTSIIAADDDIMAVSNLINGVDWYSLSDLAFLSTTKLPAGVVFSPLSAPTRFEDGVSVIIGGTNGSVHILGRDKDLLSLEQNGTSLPLCYGRSD